jgi:hypothetical protein
MRFCELCMDEEAVGIERRPTRYGVRDVCPECQKEHGLRRQSSVRASETQCPKTQSGVETCPRTMVAQP